MYDGGHSDDHHPATLAKTLARVLNKTSTTMGPSMQSKNIPKNAHKCNRDPTVPIPQSGMTADMKSRFELLLDVNNMSEAMSKALDMFDEYRDKVWVYLIEKKQEAMGMSSNVNAPDYIVHVPIYNTIKIADDSLIKYHDELVAEYTKEFSKSHKQMKGKKGRAMAMGVLQKRLKDYEMRVRELDCLFQKAFAYLEKKGGKKGQKQQHVKGNFHIINQSKRAHDVQLAKAKKGRSKRSSHVENVEIHKKITALKQRHDRKLKKRGELKKHLNPNHSQKHATIHKRIEKHTQKHSQSHLSKRPNLHQNQSHNRNSHREHDRQQNSKPRSTHTREKKRIRHHIEKHVRHHNGTKHGRHQSSEDSEE